MGGCNRKNKAIVETQNTNNDLNLGATDLNGESDVGAPGKFEFIYYID